MHRPETCSQNGQSVEMPENEKIFPAAKFCQLRVQSPKLPLTACSSKSRKRLAAFIISVHVYLCIPFFELTCFQFCKIAKFQHVCSPTVFIFDE